MVLIVGMVDTVGMVGTVTGEEVVEEGVDPTSWEDPNQTTCVTSVEKEATGPGSAPTHKGVSFLILSR